MVLTSKSMHFNPYIIDAAPQPSKSQTNSKQCARFLQIHKTKTPPCRFPTT